MNESGIIPDRPLASHQQVLEAFDAVSGRFDDSFENAITRALRDRLYDEIARLAAPGARILDINCGTGIDALALERLGFNVTGCDLSPGMVDQARKKADRESAHNVTFHVASFEDLRGVFDTPFDLVLSNFGGLNCVPDLRRVAEQVASLLPRSGIFIAVVMPRISPWDVLAAVSRGRFGSAFFRLGKNVQASGFSGKTFTVYYHPLSSLRRAFRGAFSLIHAHGLNIISPPPHATAFLKRFPRLCSILNWIERPVASLPVVRSIGDHYVAIFRRRATGSPPGPRL